MNNEVNNQLAPKYKLDAHIDEVRELYMQMCLYAIENTVTGRKYIGRTENALIRLRTHNGDLRRGANKQIGMQDDYDTHGVESFRFYVLKVYDEKTYRNSKDDEGELIRRLDNPYNKTKPVEPLRKKPYNYILHQL